MSDVTQLTKEEHQYMVQVLTQRPLGEALPLWLKLTGQQITPINGAAVVPPIPPAAH